MNAITTRYSGPTERTGARIIVKHAGTGHSMRVPFDYAARNPHAAAALVFMRRYGLMGAWVEGKTDTGSVFVSVAGDVWDISNDGRSASFISMSLGVQS